jgi:hypothetical protein
MRVLRVFHEQVVLHGERLRRLAGGGTVEARGHRTRPREVNQGYFLVPFFISVER